MAEDLSASVKEIQENRERFPKYTAVSVDFAPWVGKWKFLTQRPTNLQL